MEKELKDLEEAFNRVAQIPISSELQVTTMICPESDCDGIICFHNPTISTPCGHLTKLIEDIKSDPKFKNW